jgi:hypothetical protein
MNQFPLSLIMEFFQVQLQLGKELYWAVSQAVFCFVGTDADALCFLKIFPVKGSGELLKFLKFWIAVMRNQNDLYPIVRDKGDMISRKTLRPKLSSHCPFKLFFIKFNE